jgi:chorismate mutase
MTPEEARRILAESRARIDAIDVQLVMLLNQRTSVVEDIGRAKDAVGLPIYEPKREDDVYRNVLASNAGPMTADALKRIFERIIDEMRSLQRMRRAQREASPESPDRKTPDHKKGQAGC